MLQKLSGNVFEGMGTLGVTHQKKTMMGNEKGEEEQGGGGMGTILQLSQVLL